MASPREIRRRIRSVRNISQITRAMEMVSASKMRRAQQRVLASRPYAERLQGVIGDLASLQIGADEMSRSSRCLQQREIKHAAVILITPDRGLTGPLNSNIIRRASRYILNEAGVPVRGRSRPARRAATSWSARGRTSSPSSPASATTSRSTTFGRSPRSPSTTSSPARSTPSTSSSPASSTR